MSISSRIWEMNNHLLADYEVLTLAGADLTNVDKNILNLKPTWKERLLYFMNNGTDIVWNNWNKVTGSGTTLSLNNTEEAPMSLTYKGNTSQNTTTGKNLIGYNGDLPYTNGGITLSRENGNYKMTGTSSVWFYKKIFTIPAGTLNGNYILKKITISGESKAGIRIIDRTVTPAVTYAETNGQQQFTTINPNDLNVEITARNGDTENETFNILLQLSSISDSSYEEYTGGIPSPNPDYPQDIRVVSGDNTIKVEGKNLFSSQLETGSYEAGAKVAYAGFYRSTDKISIQPNTTYTLSINGVSQRYVLSFYNSSGTFISQDASLSNGTFTSLNNAYYITIRCFQTDYTSNYANLKIQLEKGTQATTYEPYKGATYPINLGDMELCKIGTYQDKIDKSSGKNLANVNDIIDRNVNSYYNDVNLGFQVEAGTTYTISYYAKSNVKPFNAELFLGNNNTPLGSFGANKSNINADGIVSITFTPTSEKITQYGNYLWARFVRYNTSTSYTYSATNIMIEKGSTATSYEPYGTGWYLKKEIGKVVLDGSENWQQWGTGTVFFIQKISSVRIGLSNYYKYNETATGSGQLNNGEFFIHDSANSNYVLFKNTSITTVADFKTWLGTHNTEVLYVLATPTYEIITDTTLLSQLEALKKSYDSQTNISQTNNDLPFELSVTALGELA